MITCDLRSQIKELKMEIQNNFYIKNKTFETFNALNTQFSRCFFYI